MNFSWGRVSPAKLPFSQRISPKRTEDYTKKKHLHHRHLLPPASCLGPIELHNSEALLGAEQLPK